jgi:phosphomannomutase
MKKLVVFDLDGTLAQSKSSIDAEMAALLNKLLGVIKVAVISGGNWPQFQKQVLSHLASDQRLKNLSLLPTCGTQFYKYENSWDKLYAEDFTSEQKKKIISSLKQAIEQSGLKAEKVWGEVIQDRGSQITMRPNGLSKQSSPV